MDEQATEIGRLLALQKVGELSDSYFDRLYKLTGICYHLWSVDNEAGVKMLAKFTPAIEQLTENLNQEFEKFTREHGEV